MCAIRRRAGADVRRGSDRVKAQAGLIVGLQGSLQRHHEKIAASSCAWSSVDTERTQDDTESYLGPLPILWPSAAT